MSTLDLGSHGGRTCRDIADDPTLAWPSEELRLRGGAPGALEGLAPLVGAAAARGVGVVVTPAVPTLPQTVAALESAGRLTVELTLHSAIARVHDALAGEVGHHDASLALIGALGPSTVDLRLRLPIWARRLQGLEALLTGVRAILGRPFEVRPCLPDSLAPHQARPGALPPSAEEVRESVAEAVELASGLHLRLVVDGDQGVPSCLLPATVPRASGRPRRFPVACEPCATRSDCAGLPEWAMGTLDPAGLAPRRAPAEIEWRRYESAWTRAVDHRDVGAARSALGFEGTLAAPEPGSRPPALTLGAELRSAALDLGGFERLEEVSYVAGLKPVLYLTPPRDDVAAIVARHPGSVVELIDPAAEHVAAGVSRAHAHLFLGHDAGDVAQVADAYRRGDPTRQAAAIGRLMGYPPCCAEVFARGRDNATDAQNVVDAARRTRGRGHGLLNQGITFLAPFYPCSYDCDAAAAFAEGTVRALFPHSPDAMVERLEAEMARPTLYFGGVSIVMDGERRAETVEFRSARVVARTAREAELAWAAAGGLFDAPGSLALGEGPWHLVRADATMRVDRSAGAPGVLLPFSPRTS